MAIPLNSSTLSEGINKLAVFYFLRILDGVNLNIVNNNENIVADGVDYIGIPFNLSGNSESITEEVPKITLTFNVPNIQDYAFEYATIHSAYHSTNGLVGKKITVTPRVYILNPQPSLVDMDYNLFTYDLYVVDSTITSSNIALACKFKNKLSDTFPAYRYSTFCRFEFGDYKCGYNKTEGQTCNKNWEDCKAYNNTPNFGGFIGLGDDRFRVIQ